MLVPVSVMILASQPVIAVSDDVPKFNIERGCKVDSTAAFDLNAGLNEKALRDRRATGKGSACSALVGIHRR
jgi:hypothetical protein